jgi:hypothetical protein
MRLLSILKELWILLCYKIETNAAREKTGRVWDPQNTFPFLKSVLNDKEPNHLANGHEEVSKSFVLQFPTNKITNRMYSRPIRPNRSESTETDIII